MSKKRLAVGLAIASYAYPLLLLIAAPEHVPTLAFVPLWVLPSATIATSIAELRDAGREKRPRLAGILALLFGIVALLLVVLGVLVGALLLGAVDAASKFR